MRFVPVFAVIVTALALYASGAVLDQVVTGSGLTRIALLPPWQSIGGFLAIGLLALLWLDRRAVPRASATAVRPPIGPLLLPVFGLLLLLLPYLPVLSDALPALQVLAGPLRVVVWVVTVSQVLWVLWQVRLLRADWLQHASIRQLAVGAGVATALLAGAAAVRLTNTELHPAGDEPHYLVMAQSLWRDGDLKIENNQERGDLREYYQADLDPQHLARGRDGETYSVHPVGMPVLIAPIYALGGYAAVVAAFIVMAAVAGGLTWHMIAAATNDAGAATFGWASVVATSPFLFNTFAVSPEIPAALIVAAAFYLITPSTAPWWRYLLAGLACSALPWLGTNYTPMSAALVLVALGRIVRPEAGPRRHRSTEAAAGATALLVPYGVSLLGWSYFSYATWGGLLPQTADGPLVQTGLTHLIAGGPGLLFDQEFGLLPYAPVYILAAAGLWTLWRSSSGARRIAVEIAMVFVALLGTVGAFRTWWGESAAPGRPIVSALLLLAVPIAAAFRAAPAGSARRAAHVLLLWTSIGISVILLASEQGFLTINDRDGTSRLLESLSPRWPLWSVAPSFIYHEAATALLHTAGWLLVAGLAAVGVGRIRLGHPGVISSLAIAAASLASLTVLVVMPLLPLRPAWPPVDIRARARVPLLDQFDAVARPFAVEYTPWRAERAGDIVARASLELEPGLRTEQQPTRVLHNGRFSLPAGSYRMEVEWSGARDGETIGLQIGRTGNAWQSWPVNPRPGAQWDVEFSLPLDASFVGLRGTPELERVVRHVRIVPAVVVDETRRPRTSEVVAASRSNGASLFYYDANAFQEEQGFWVRRARRTRVTIHRPQGNGALTLRVHGGPVGNQLRLASFGWERTVRLLPHRREDIEVPSGTSGLVTLELTAADGFVPREIDPGSTDPRPLGVWIEVAR